MTVSRRDFLKMSTTTVAAGAVASTLGSVALAEPAAVDVQQPFDTLIKNGRVFNGDGKTEIRGDVGIKDGKIAAIGRLGTNAKDVVDVDGLVISPGFIDIHAHSDTNYLLAPKGDSRIFQGITLDVGGNCGGSPFPVRPYKSVTEFMAALSEKGFGVNYATFLGQGEVREAVIGTNATPATPETLEKMKAIVDEQLSQGCIGLSFGLEYAPGCYGSDEELTELLKVVAKHDALYAIHMRNEDDHVEEAIAEAIQMARQSGARLEISHLKAQNANNWHRAPAMLRQIEEASKELDIAFDRYPYIAFSNGLISFVPMLDRQGSDDDVLARLQNPEDCKRIREYAETRLRKLGGPDHVLIISARTEPYRRFIGKNIGECCEMTGLEPWPFIQKTLLDERLFPDIVAFAMNEDNVKTFLAHPLGMPASDGYVYSPTGPLSKDQPHPRSYGTFPRFFGKYVRDEKICDLATAIRKATALPASRLKLKDRGMLLPGYQADVVVFNPDTIIDRATFEKPHQFPIGIEHVFVNGAWAVKNGEHTGALAGQWVKLS